MLFPCGKCPPCRGSLFSLRASRSSWVNFLFLFLQGNIWREFRFSFGPTNDRAFLNGADLNPGERHSCVTRDDSTVCVRALHPARRHCTATQLLRRFWASLAFNNLRNKGSKNSGNFRSIFPKTIRALKNIFRAKIRSADVPPWRKGTPQGTSTQPAFLFWEGNFAGHLEGIVLWDFSNPQNLEEDKRATTNVQNRFVQFFLLSFLLFCSHWAKTLCFEGESPGGKSAKKC